MTRSPGPRLTTALGVLLLLTAWPGRRPAAQADLDVGAASLARGAVPSSQIAPAGAAVVDFTQLAREEASRARSTALEPSILISHEVGEHAEPSSPFGALAVWGPHDVVLQTNVPSPSPTSSFAGLDDIPKQGTGTVVIPPDTQGAVGPTRILNTLNNNYRILDKTDGAAISTVSIDSFWSSTGGTGVFDPKTLYDPYQNRFIVAAVSNSETTSSSLLVGVSATSDPAGSWTLARYQLGATMCPGGVACWADYPTLGFNQTWIAVSVNMFSNSSNSFQEARVNVLNYATLRGGTAPTDQVSPTSLAFTIHPVATYSTSETTLYAAEHIGSDARSYALDTVTGTADAPVFTLGDVKTHSLIGNWTIPGSPGLPQLGGTGTIDPGDARVSSAIFRNNAIWYTQTVGLPAGGSATHTAAQWVKLDTSGNDLDAGRVEDSTATSGNGGKWYAYPSIAVNANDDALLGFSEFSATRYASAAYAFRASTDAAGTMQDPVAAKSGEDYYYKTFGGSRNRWGDYSATQVDPSDDLSFWTVQEYAKSSVSGTSHWGTWWAKVVPPSTGPTSDPAMAVDVPTDESAVGSTFTVSGWAVDLSASSGAGVDYVHGYGYPISGFNGTVTGDAVFLGQAAVGNARSDVGVAYGSRFTNSGFSMSVSALPSGGKYRIYVHAHSVVAAFNNFSDPIDVAVGSTASDPVMFIDQPASGAVLSASQPFTVAGWAFDRGSSSGAGIFDVHVWAFPVGASLPSSFVWSAGSSGAGALNQSRPDIGAVYGSQFANSGYRFSVPAGRVPAGAYDLYVFTFCTLVGSSQPCQARITRVTVQ